MAADATRNWLQACLNGPRRAGEHRALPIHPPEIARSALSCREAGAFAAHVHPRDERGAESLQARHVGAAVRAVRAVAPGMQVGVSTAESIEENLTRRLRAIASWEDRPDFATVNWYEHDADETASLLVLQGVAVQAVLATVADARRMLRSPLAAQCRVMVVGPREEDADAAVRTAEAILAVLDEAAPTVPRLVHGHDATTWPLLQLAISRGYLTRIGMEDTLLLPSGERCNDNAQLVRHAQTIAAAARKEEEPTS